MREDYIAAEMWLDSHHPADIGTRAMFLFLKGLIVAAARNAFRTQADLTIRAISLLQNGMQENRRLAEVCTETLAFIVRDVPDIEGLACMDAPCKHSRLMERSLTLCSSHTARFRGTWPSMVTIAALFDN